MTTAGMGEAEMGQIASFVARVLREPGNDAELASVREEVVTLCSKFSPYP
jgi:glycine/serine hydroxymethyltransferase